MSKEKQDKENFSKFENQLTADPYDYGFTRQEIMEARKEKKEDEQS